MSVLAIDIGGVSLKAAHSVTQPICRPFNVCSCPDRLADELLALSYAMPHFDQLLITMTAELCDCYMTKRDGVSHIIEAADKLADGREMMVWSTCGKFVAATDALREPMQCAAGNWHALATTIALLEPGDGVTLLIDTGSTTTDITCLSNGSLITRGLTDSDRLSSGGLVYVGADATPVAYLGTAISWRGKRISLMAEPFATTGDIYLAIGQQQEEATRTDTPDGRARTKLAATRRLVRMVGADLDIINEADAISLADVLSEMVIKRIADEIKRVVDGQPIRQVIVAGSGEQVALQAAQSALPGVTTIRLSDRIGEAASTAACAWALLQIHANRSS